MASHGRFATAVIPAYLVGGRLLSALPPAISALVTSVLSAGLVCWTALSVTGHNFY